MKRRELLKCVIGWVAGVAVMSPTSAALSSESDRLETVRRMLAETPAQRWSSRSGYGSTLVYFGDGQAFEVVFQNHKPLISTRELTTSERSDLGAYQKTLNRHVPQRVGTVLCNNEWRLRGWIYNGRDPHEWIMSAEKIAI